MRRAAFAIAAASVAIVAGGVSAAAAGPTTVVVTPANFATIFSAQTATPTSSDQFVVGPGTPPLGVGSLELTTVDSAGHQQYLERQQPPPLTTPISTINLMGYSTYRHAESTSTDPTVVAAINMEIFTNPAGSPGNQGYDTLVFEPYLNPQTAQTVTSNTWQTWDAYQAGAAIWTSTHTIGGVAAHTQAPWSTIVASNPNAVIIGYGPNQGSANPGLISNVDALKIGTSDGNSTTYDFEPPAPVNTPEVPLPVLLIGIGGGLAAVATLRSRRRRSASPG